MNTTFDTWLREIEAAKKLATDIKSAVRGEPWQMVIRFQGNWASGTLQGTISSAPDGSTLATVSISSGSFDAGTGFTTWTVSLAGGSGSNSTGGLPVDFDGNGVEAFPIAFYLTPSGGTRELLMGGAFIVLGKV